MTSGDIKTFGGFPVVVCSGCKVKMDVTETTASPFLSLLCTVHYYCPVCEMKTTREVKREREQQTLL